MGENGPVTIPQSFIQELIDRTDIVEVVGRYVQLKKGGANFMGLCPFHGEKSPSFSVSPSKQFFHCFGCGKNGNAIGFLMEHAGMGFVEAVQELAQSTGLQVPQDDVSPQERERAAARRQQQATLTDVLEKAAQAYSQQLRTATGAVQYLKGRGVSGALAKRYGLGYAPPGWHGLASVFAHYDDPLLLEAGLVIVNDENLNDVRRYDRFRDRVMFPIRNVKGECIGFGGRVLGDDKPKYLNSPETPLFHKGRELYGLFEARTAIRERGLALVTEGYMDVVALAQLGFPNAVATLGTACTPEHLGKLFRFTDTVVFSFDGDSAGRRAARKALDNALPHATDTRSIRFLFLPAQHDPDSYVRESGAAAFEHCIADAVPLSRQLITLASDGCDLETAEGRSKLVAQARPLLAQLPAGVLRGQISDALAQAAHIQPDDLRRSGVAAGDRNVAAGVVGARPRLQTTRGQSLARRQGPRPSLLPMANSLDRAVWMLIHRTDLWERLGNEAHALLTQQAAPYGEFFAWLDRLIQEHGTLAPGALLLELDAAAAPAALNLLAARVGRFHEIPAGDEAQHEINVIVDRLRLRQAQAELERLAETSALSAPMRARQLELLRRQRELKERLSRPTGASTL